MRDDADTWERKSHDGERGEGSNADREHHDAERNLDTEDRGIDPLGVARNNPGTTEERGRAEGIADTSRS